MTVLFFDTSALAKVQLAAACEIQRQRVIAGLSALTFVSSDNELNAATIVEGFVVENPLEHA